MSGRETALHPRARALAAALREAREAQGIRLTHLAHRLGIAHGTLSKWELGHQVAKLEQVAMVLGALNVPRSERDRIINIAREAHEPNWLTVGVHGVPSQLSAAIECERAAKSITEWNPFGVPGLLQTMDYTRVLLDILPDSLVENRLVVHEGRKGTIEQPASQTAFLAFIGEAALRQPVGQPAVMVGQLNHLERMARKPNVVVRVVPVYTGYHPGWAGPFVLYEFADTRPSIYFEHYSSGAFVDAEHDVSAYRSAITQLESIAYDAETSLTLIAEAAEKPGDK